jgi:hypothetical protein
MRRTTIGISEDLQHKVEAWGRPRGLNLSASIRLLLNRALADVAEGGSLKVPKEVS